MKTKIIEIIEIGDPQSHILRDGEPIAELIKNWDLVEELNKYLILNRQYTVDFQDCDCNFDKPIPKNDGSDCFEYRCPKCGKLETY